MRGSADFMAGAALQSEIIQAAKARGGVCANRSDSALGQTQPSGAKLQRHRREPTIVTGVDALLVP